MPDTKSCSICKGQGYIQALVSMQEKKKETVKCPTCNGKGVIHQMTDEEERDYHDNYW